MTSRLPAPELPPWLARMLPFQRSRVAIGGLRLHVMESGAGAKVVMVHGNPTWGFLYRRVAQELAGDPLACVMPDLPGLGLSDKPAASFHTLERHAQTLAALFDALELRRFVLVVQDWGGPIAVGAVASRPALEVGLVVLNTVLAPPRPGFRPTAFHRFARLPVVSDVAFRGLGFPERAMRFAQGDRGSIRGDVARAYRFPLRRFADRVAPLALARMVPPDHDHASIAELARVRAWVEAFEGPAEIVWGDRDPILGRVRSFVERLLPRARVTRTEAGHFLQEEVPREIADAVRRVAAALG